MVRRWRPAQPARGRPVSVAYTLAMFFFWGLAMAVVGGVIGWLLRSLSRRREVTELRAQVAELEAAARKRGPTPGPPL